MLTLRQILFITCGVIGIVTFGGSILTSSFGVQGNTVLFYGLGLLAFVCALIIMWTTNQENTQRSRFPAPTLKTKLAICFMLLGSVTQASVLVFKDVVPHFFILLSLLSYGVGIAFLLQASRRQTK